MELSRKILILIYGRAFSFLISLIIPIILTRLLLKEDYGAYQQLVMLYTIIQAVLLLGMPRALLYYYPRIENNERSMLIKQTWVIIAFSSFFIILASWIFGELLLQISPNSHLQPFIFLLGIYTGIMLLVMPLQNLIILEGKESLAIKYMIGFTILDVIILPLAAWINPSTLGIVHGIIVTAVLKVILVLHYIYFKYLNKQYTGNTYYRKQLAYGIPVGLTTMIYVININIDKYMVGLFFSNSVFAVYYLGSLWAPMFGWITQSVSQVVIPRMSKAHKNNNLLEIKKLYSKSIERLAFIFLPTMFLLILISKPFILTLFTDTYEGTVPIFFIYLFLLPTYALNLGWILMASGQTKFLLRLAIFLSLINIILSYGFLTILEGDNRLLGIPLATVIITWFSTIIIMYQSLKTLNSGLFDTYNWKKIFTIGAASAVSTIPVIGIQSLDLENEVFLISSILLYGITFLLASFKFKILTDAEINLIKSFLPFKS